RVGAEALDLVAQLVESNRHAHAPASVRPAIPSRVVTNAIQVAKSEVGNRDKPGPSRELGRRSLQICILEMRPVRECRFLRWPASVLRGAWGRVRGRRGGGPTLPWCGLPRGRGGGGGRRAGARVGAGAAGPV